MIRVRTGDKVEFVSPYYNNAQMMGEIVAIMDDTYSIRLESSGRIANIDCSMVTFLRTI